MKRGKIIIRQVGNGLTAEFIPESDADFEARDRAANPHAWTAHDAIMGLQCPARSMGLWGKIKRFFTRYP